MKKILLLGGSQQQIPAIRAAKEKGLYTILCDYLEDNPGQYFADKFFLISTTDPEAVLGIAKAEEIDYVMAYASDPAAPTAAYVAEQLGLPGNPFEAVSILCNKERFRNFQRAHGFAAPAGCGYGDVEEALRDIKNNRFRFPVIAKPTDSSGSKGVGRIDGIAEAEEKLKTAFRFSREGRIVACRQTADSSFRASRIIILIWPARIPSFRPPVHFRQISPGRCWTESMRRSSACSVSCT